MRTFLALLSVFIVLILLTFAQRFSSAENEADVAGAFGDPIPGLSGPEKDFFERGRAVFKMRFTRADGLGPHFNASSCASCHEEPVAGGSSQRYRDFFLVGRTQPDGSVKKAYPSCTAETAVTQRSSPCLPSLVMPHYGPKGTLTDPVAPSVEHVGIPFDADVASRRNAPPLFGVGLFRLVSDAEILSRADPDDADHDGISGRVNIISTESNAIGRFGYKCQTASIEAFNRGAFVNQMGITSDSTKLETGDAFSPRRERWIDQLFSIRTAEAQVANPTDHIIDFDGVPDPEIPRNKLLPLIFFQENLAAPLRGAITPSVIRGDALFAGLRCTDCHVPSLTTPIGLIHPYTDLLIHDMGPDLADGVVQERAAASEFRTQPLWGVCQHAPFLHDGRADTLEQAILSHGGEATVARDAYQALSAREKHDVQKFLESL